MAEKEKEQAEQLKRRADVKEALEQATPPPEARKIPTKRLNAEPERVRFPRGDQR